MNSSTSEIPVRLSESQREALISLLADDDPNVYQTVRQKLIAYGHEAAEWLRPHTLSDDPQLRRRVKSIISHFVQQDADNEFLAFCLGQGDDFDLEEALWLLARTKYPQINPEGYRAILDNFARDLREQLKKTVNSAQLLGAINDYLFKAQGFSGNEKNYYEPENNYLNCVIDRRTGNPISLSTIYLLIGRRLRLPIVGIGLPGHFICRYQTITEEIYVDPFSKGRLLTKADCVKYLHANNHTLQDEFLAPVTPRRIMMRVCSNLHQIYHQMSAAQDVACVQRYLVALAR